MGSPHFYAAMLGVAYGDAWGYPNERHSYGRLTLLDPVDAMKRRVPVEQARRVYGDKLPIESRSGASDLAALYAGWLAG